MPVSIVGTGAERESYVIWSMIPRYTMPEMAAVFSDVGPLRPLPRDRTAGHRGARGARRRARGRRRDVSGERAPTVDDAFVQAVSDREAITDHDVAAFVDVVQGAIGAPAGAWIHYGLTSSDVVDTAWCWMMRDACDLLLAAADELLRTLVRMAREHRDTVMIGRTHGIHAEPTTFGAKVALWALQVDRDRTRLRAARESVAVCKLSGAVGTYSNIDPSIEAPRRRRARADGRCPPRRSSPATATPSSCTRAPSVGATMELIAVELRHLQRTEVREVQEGFKAGPEGLQRDAAQAQPDQRRDHQRALHACCAATCRPACRTWRCGTSATSRTARSSASCCPTAPCSPTT